MKKFIYTLVFAVLAVFVSSCNEDDKGTEYPGNIIIHGDVFHLKLFRADATADSNTKKKARFYAFSGGSNNDLSAMNPTDWTYEMWIKVSRDARIGDPNAVDAVEANGDCISMRSGNFEMYLIQDDDADFAIKYARLNLQDEQLLSISTVNSTEKLTFDKWFHIAVSRNSTDNMVKIYLNGKLSASSTDPLFAQPVNDKWLQFNYIYRNGNFTNFFVGSMKNIRVSTIDRYPAEFTPPFPPQFTDNFVVDDNTLLQLDLEKNLTPFDDTSSNYPDYNKIEIKGFYNPYYIKLHNNYVSWDTEIIEEYPASGY